MSRDLNAATMRTWQSQRRRIDLTAIASAPRVDAILRHLDVHCAATLDHLGLIEVRSVCGVVGKMCSWHRVYALSRRQKNKINSGRVVIQVFS